MKELFRRLRFLLHRREFEQELEEEMRHHLALKAEAQGTAPFGNITLLKEESRAMWTFTFWEQLGQDIRYGLRAMAANRVFTTMAILSLALGIGANTAIYSYMDAVLLRTLPVRHPEELVILQWHSNGRAGAVHGVNGSMYRDGKKGSVSPNFPYAAFEQLKAGSNGTLSTLFAYAGAYSLNLVAAGQAEVVRGVYASGGYFSGLGVTPAAGRLILPDDDRAGATPVVVLSYDYWQRRYGRNASAVGQKLLINNVPFVIAGVSAPDFFGLDAGASPSVFMPLHQISMLQPEPVKDEQRRFFNRTFYWVEMSGRLRPGVSREQAQSQLAGQFRQYVESTITTPKERENMPALLAEDGASGLDSLRRMYSKPLFVLMTMVGLILAVACANIASLLLARSAARRREIAVRLSLGAGRMRVIRQLLTESMLLSLCGGLLGMLVAFGGIRAIGRLLADRHGEMILRAGLNLPVLGFTFALAILTGLIFGLAPALQATKLDLTPALKETRASAVRKHSRFGLRFGLGHALVVSQISLSLVLVIAASLFIRTLANLRSVELGFNQESLLLFTLNARQAGYKDAAIGNLYGTLQDRFRAVPGVKSVGLSQNALTSGYWNSEDMAIAGMPSDKSLSTCLMVVSDTFLGTMEIPVLLGRGITARDLQSPRVAVVTEEFVKKFLNGKNPIGQRIALRDAKGPADIEIVGVARDSRYNDLKNENPPVAYVPYTQDLKGLGRVTFELRAQGSPLALVNTVRQIVHQESAALPVGDITTQTDTIDEMIKQERTFANLCGFFAALALMIASVGLYGTMAYAVARRTGEIGIRMALGAQRRGVIWMVLREVLALACVGLGIGLFGAWETASYVASFLFEMKPGDPVAIGASVAVLVVAAIVAGYAPARRASRVDPMVALRHE